MKGKTKRGFMIFLLILVLMLMACTNTSKESESTTLQEYTDVSIDDANFETFK